MFHSIEVFHGEGAWSGLVQSTEVQPLRFVYPSAYLNSYDESAAKPHYLHSKNAGELQDMPL